MAEDDQKMKASTKSETQKQVEKKILKNEEKALENAKFEISKKVSFIGEKPLFLPKRRHSF